MSATSRPGPPEPTRSEKERSVVRQAMTRFLLLGGISLVVVAMVTAVMANAVARAVATREAEDRTLTFTRVIAGPALDASTMEDLASSPLVQALRNRLLDDSISHAAVYDPDGTVIWSADPAAVGTTEPLSAEVRALIGTTGTVSHFSRETHAGGGEEDLVLEVYASGVDADGRPFVMEWYWPTSHLRESQAQVMRLLLPATLGSLLLFALLILPLTLSTARRVERDRARLTRHALDASRLERRRLSEDLHDGVVQDLSGIGYVLPMLGQALPAESQAQPLLTQIQQTMQRDIATIRGMIADIRPVDLRGDGLREALDGLASRMSERGVATTAHLDCDVESLSTSARALVYRVALEGARNVLKHSHAEHARVEVAGQDSQVRVRVWDDGAGSGPDRSVRQPDEESDHHFGLALLEEAVSDLDGGLTLGRAAEGGTELVVVFRPDRVLV
ncbi:histidine kinase [Ornithinimicrobium pekingense]|uniref:sensor histidine kinase n=1 Tax=Ornithinimicrobium pekingense TaxID=384677 RepID=UPI0012EC5A65|nr:histidine kinase [Ornithinimicrobium pekingense]